MPVAQHVSEEGPAEADAGDQHRLLRAAWEQVPAHDGPLLRHADVREDGLQHGHGAHSQAAQEVVCYFWVQSVYQKGLSFCESGTFCTFILLKPPNF